jgi:hypothetical protein
MRLPAMAWTCLLLALTATAAIAQDARFVDDEALGRPKGAQIPPTLVREPAAPAAVVPGRAKGANTGEFRLFDADLLQLVGGGSKDKDKDKGKQKAKDQGKGEPAKTKLPQPPTPPALPESPESDLLTRAENVGAESFEGLSPRMIGDLPGFFSLQRILVPSVKDIITFTTIETDRGILSKVVSVKQVPTFVAITAHLPLAFAGPIKIGENQSPLPQDRAYITYNYYNGIQGQSGPGMVNSQVVPGVFPNFSVVNTPVPGGLPAIDLHRETFGFEKLILGGNASVGMRMPFAQMQGDGTIGRQDIGDLSGIFNYAFFKNPITGSGLAGGLMLTAPTGPPNYTVVGNIHPWLFQPFVGYRFMSDRMYLQGFSSVLTPTDARYVTAMFNDLAAGYWLYRGNPGQTIWAVIPTVEAHVTNPFNHRNLSDPIAMPNFVTLTAGVHIGLAGGSMLTIGTTVPVSGPRLFPIEAVVQFNYRYGAVAPPR